MCFSPEADAVVGGIVVVSRGRRVAACARRSNQIPFASLPLLFGLHQVSEAFVWWGLQGNVAHTVERAALWAYLLFAFARAARC